MSTAILAAGLSALLVTTQEPKPAQLGPATAKFPVERNMSLVPRELRDGRILLNDSAQVVVIDMKSGKKTGIPDLPIGGLFPLAADSTLVKNTGGWAFLAGIRPLGMLPSTNKVVAASPVILGFDSLGYVFAQRDFARDSMAVFRINRESGKEEEVARIKRFPGVRGGEQGPVYSVFERAIVSGDGWLAVLRTAPYRVDWRKPSGEWIKGAPIPVKANASDVG